MDGLRSHLISAGNFLETNQSHETKMPNPKTCSPRKAPNTKLQAPEKFQTSNSKHPSSGYDRMPRFEHLAGNAKEMSPFGVWDLELLWSLDLGTWIFNSPSPACRPWPSQARLS